MMFFLRTLFFAMSLLVVSTIFSGCTDTRKKITAQSDVGTLANGYWEVQNEKLPSSSKVKGLIYEYGRYGIKSEADKSVTITWDNGLSCTRSKGNIQGDKITLVDRGVSTELIVHDPQKATIKFEHGQKNITRELKKIRTDPKIICY